VQSREQRSRADDKSPPRNLLDPVGDAHAVHRPQVESAEDEQIERALQDLYAFCH